ncbi:MAG: hypothetical protein CM15mP49_35510 [Actinomycetota bacterium]|nr:MAG: hypothetical protein CM15mP49_35510 [Actinomycetota bacterium]
MHFSNQGDVDVQSIAGLIGTGVHGTGITHPSISTHVQDATSLQAQATLSKLPKIRMFLKQLD